MALQPILDYLQPGGYHFVDTTGGLPVRIEGTSYLDVAEKVLKHRLSNGRAPGDPMRELVEYVCRSHPVICKETNPQPIPPSGKAPRLSLATKVSEWFASFFTSARTDPGIPFSETERRAAICSRCRYNEHISGCGSCIANIDRLFFVWRRDRPVAYERELGGCTVLGQHNAAATLSSRLPDLPPESRAQLPENCWRKNL